VISIAIRLVGGMTDIKADICSIVRDGETFSTKKEVWIKLARVHAPKEGTVASIKLGSFCQISS
jgi:hypothetical protein